MPCLGFIELIFNSNNSQLTLISNVPVLCTLEIVLWFWGYRRFAAMPLVVGSKLVQLAWGSLRPNFNCYVGWLVGSSNQSKEKL
jgi:hypothetical protein